MFVNTVTELRDYFQLYCSVNATLFFSVHLVHRKNVGAFISFDIVKQYVFDIFI